jgi:hypothetical protein
MDSLGALNAFVQAAEGRSFTVAGRQLGVSSSAIGKAVVRMKERLGVRLFHRSTRSVTLTAEGALFLERCRRIFSEIEAAELELSQTQEAPRGTLRVSPPLVGMLMMPTIVAFMRNIKTGAFTLFREEHGRNLHTVLNLCTPDPLEKQQVLYLTRKLRKLGSELGRAASEHVCPTCHQSVSSELLPAANRPARGPREALLITQVHPRRLRYRGARGWSASSRRSHRRSNTNTG